MRQDEWRDEQGERRERLDAQGIFRVHSRPAAPRSP